jgi:hypothetical protein
LAGKHAASFIHTTGLAASLLGKATTLISPAEIEGEGGRGRAAAAQARGGVSRGQVLWPQDAGAADLASGIHTLPPVVHPAFTQPAHTAAPGLPDEYLLYHGRGERATLLQLLESWTWAAASIGELYPLILSGLSAEMGRFVESKLPDFHLQDYVRVVQLAPADLPAAMRGCAAFIHPETPAAWGNPLRHALACGKAIVALQEPLTESIVGPAAYLVAPGDLRSLGAATITVVVDEKAREPLEEQAKQKSARWSADAFKKRLSEVYALAAAS